MPIARFSISTMRENRETLLARLRALCIETNTIDHPAVYTVEESKALRGDLHGAHSKNLFLRDKKGRLWLLVALEDRDVDIKVLRKSIGAAQLSFGKPELLLAVMGIEPGSVTPFGVINDADLHVTVVLDSDLLDAEVLNFHPLTNTATTRITPGGLLTFLCETGHKPLIVAL